MDINPLIFRAYDVRGIYGKDLTENIMERIGAAFSGFVGNKIVLGYDNRNSSPSLRDAFIKGITEAGVDVTDIGLVPRGMLMFWCLNSKLPGAYITASHNPSEWNGVQFMHENGQGFFEEENMKIRDVVLQGKLKKTENKGAVNITDIKKEYIKALVDTIPNPSKSLKILLDCGNGTAGVVAQEVFKSKGMEADVIFKEPDGNFPNRESDLTEETLKHAMSMAGNYDVVFAYDGDSDRLALIDNKGRLVSAEITSYIILKELLKEAEGPVIANVECSKIIDRIAREYNRNVNRVRVGNAFMVHAIHSNSACFGVETSRHFVIPSVFPFDDAIAVSLFAAYALSQFEERFSDIIDKIPKFVRDRVNFECDDDKKFTVMERIKERFSKEYKKINTLDGIRVDFDNSWILVRASNTSPLIRLTVEAEDEEEFEKLKKKFSEIVREEIEK